VVLVPEPSVPGPQLLARLELPLVALEPAPLLGVFEARLPGPQSVRCMPVEPIELPLPLVAGALVVPAAEPLPVSREPELVLGVLPAPAPVFCARATPPRLRARIDAVARTRRFIAFSSMQDSPFAGGDIRVLHGNIARRIDGSEPTKR
jgi:hypothetical protein